MQIPMSALLHWLLPLFGDHQQSSSLLRFRQHFFIFMIGILLPLWYAFTSSPGGFGHPPTYPPLLEGLCRHNGHFIFPVPRTIDYFATMGGSIFRLPGCLHLLLMTCPPEGPFQRNFIIFDCYHKNYPDFKMGSIFIFILGYPHKGNIRKFSWATRSI